MWYLHVPKHQKAIVVTGYKPVDNFNIAELWSFKLSDLGIPGVKLTICARGVTSGAKFETIASGTTRWPNLQSRQVAPLSVVKDLLDWVCCASIYDMLPPGLVKGEAPNIVFQSEFSEAGPSLGTQFVHFHTVCLGGMPDLVPTEAGPSLGTQFSPSNIS